jgi:hypothetical protein
MFQCVSPNHEMRRKLVNVMKRNRIRLTLVGVGLGVAALAALLSLREWSGPSSESAVAAGSGQATMAGITVKVLAVESSAAETAVTFVVLGRDDFGEVLESFARPVLIDSAGVRVGALRGSRDADLPRQYTVVFDRIAADGPVKLVVGDLVFESRAAQAARVERARNGEAIEGLPSGREVRGVWEVEASIAQSGSAREFPLKGVAADFGPGRIVVDKVVLTSDITYVFGHIEGLAAESFQDLEIAPASLSVSGAPAAFLGGRSGYGSGNASFELRFANASGREAVLTVPFYVRGAPGESPSGADESIARFAGSRATLAFPLPE